jgi:hypothetical protein
MSWVFLGTSSDISLGVDSSGSFRLGGGGTQNCNPSGGDLAVVGLTKNVPPLWEITPAANVCRRRNSARATWSFCEPTPTLAM